ncbi:MAG TPA: acyl-CoA carboxylase subunit epsilon [Streptosporangiaceae bacterium]|nr:acyl-CoA carboxylase subunit epsilon [Streptosporangiaceae bacterium]
MTHPGQDDRPAGEPLLRVVRGDATPEETAALVAVLMARSGSAGRAARRPGRTARGAWSDRSGLMRRPLRPGPGAWRRSAVPW